ncbi:Synaptotagmin-9 [Seminavis robusta]|uniref:Synaptotagmin-9 n=1 Tax=Seminavis robusta TaxID=568900 RepID=A0A9N8E5T3_9STRA|nr:Synaptotagmin-9 [Seminavis robusta]|eukprot:Sro572_g168770.1 Synaptotagmin-9 (134) ;mRNA; f:24396-24797
MGVLTVFLDKATNLADTDFIGKTDPYVIFDLKQDNWLQNRDYGYQRSSTKSNDLHPVYGETFIWKNIEDIENLVLKVRIMDADFGSRDDKVGNCTIQLDKLGLSSRPMNVDRVVDRNIFTANGMIHLRVSYDA